MLTIILGRNVSIGTGSYWLTEKKGSGQHLDPTSGRGGGEEGVGGVGAQLGVGGY